MKISLSSQWRKFKRRRSRWKHEIGARMRRWWKTNGRGEVLFFLRRLALILALLIVKHLLIAGCGDDPCSSDQTERLAATIPTTAAGS